MGLDRFALVKAQAQGCILELCTGTGIAVLQLESHMWQFPFQWSLRIRNLTFLIAFRKYFLVSMQGPMKRVHVRRSNGSRRFWFTAALSLLGLLPQVSEIELQYNLLHLLSCCRRKGIFMFYDLRPCTVWLICYILGYLASASLSSSNVCCTVMFNICKTFFFSTCHLDWNLSD